MQVGLRNNSALGPARKIGGIRPCRKPCVSRRALSVRNQSCLIVNTKGGGHAFIGLHLAQELIKRGHSVTICNDGDQTKLSSKTPFSQYSQLERQGATVTWGSPTDPATWPKGEFEVVYDNNGKDLESCKPLIDQHMGKAKHYVFVGSAGAYNANSIEPCHYEGDARKASAGHVEVEKYLELINMPYTVFQPLYIYGPHTAKDCEQWFIDRIARDRPVPIPAPGIQLTTLTHVEDVATMLASVPGNPKAVGQHYNVCSDRCISFLGIVNALSKAMGKQPNSCQQECVHQQSCQQKVVHIRCHANKSGAHLQSCQQEWCPSAVMPASVVPICSHASKSGAHQMSCQQKRCISDVTPARVVHIRCHASKSGAHLQSCQQKRCTSDVMPARTGNVYARAARLHPSANQGLCFISLAGVQETVTLSKACLRTCAQPVQFSRHVPHSDTMIELHQVCIVFNHVPCLAPPKHSLPCMCTYSNPFITFQRHRREKHKIAEARSGCVCRRKLLTCSCRSCRDLEGLHFWQALRHALCIVTSAVP
ncbi:hypothetical protein DUNSADRAFT_8767 [Dunaliella salina]|uniref:NAD-dependent epimerase/dehydratase domain-containing protein n=1 Tax=Dunaliella salina TaxID=3046 RepID=A0ABQ7GIU6_DUNSA|nr:hypothetical protein DUNSADRAFT_8767 [Dunaliella salina]|eukprot:KAF5834516.1 hypothetical protein DUNSADRAFT_8767 [Dunaliella salina]